jgi:hypothetical protein
MADAEYVGRGVGLESEFPDLDGGRASLRRAKGDPSPNSAMHKAWALGLRQGIVEPIMGEGGFRLISVRMVGPAQAPSSA